MNENTLPDLYELWDFNDPAATAVTFHKLLPQAKASGNIGYLIELLTQIARTEGLQGNFDKAHAILDEAEAMLTPILPIPQIRYWLERGRTHNSSGEKETAVTLFKQAYELGQQVGEPADFYTIDAAHMLGIAMPTSDEQLEWNLIALKLIEETAVTRAQKWRGSLLNNIGWTYHAKDDFIKALDMFEQALVWHEQHMQDKPDRIRIAKWCVARAYRSLERYDEALKMQEALADEHKQLNNPPDGFVVEEIGECLLALGQTEAAQPYFAQAHEHLSQISWVEKDRLERIKNLGKGKSE